MGAPGREPDLDPTKPVMTSPSIPIRQPRLIRHADLRSGRGPAHHPFSSHLRLDRYPSRPLGTSAAFPVPRDLPARADVRGSPRGQLSAAASSERGRDQHNAHDDRGHAEQDGYHHLGVDYWPRLATGGHGRQHALGQFEMLVFGKDEQVILQGGDRHPTARRTSTARPARRGRSRQTWQPMPGTVIRPSPSSNRSPSPPSSCAGPCSANQRAPRRFQPGTWPQCRVPFLILLRTIP